jgi:hypothetical protein
MLIEDCEENFRSTIIIGVERGGRALVFLNESIYEMQIPMDLTM